MEIKKFSMYEEYINITKVYKLDLTIQADTKEELADIQKKICCILAGHYYKRSNEVK